METLLLRDMFVFALAVLACYRLAILIASDDGPGDVLLRLRARLGAYDYGDDGRPETSAGRLVSCEYCVGVWIAAALALLLFPIGLMSFVYWLSIAGGQAFLWSVTDAGTSQPDSAGQV